MADDAWRAEPSARHTSWIAGDGAIARADGFRRSYLQLISWLRPARRKIALEREQQDGQNLLATEQDSALGLLSRSVSQPDQGVQQLELRILRITVMRSVARAAVSAPSDAGIAATAAGWFRRIRLSGPAHRRIGPRRFSTFL